MNFNIEPYFDDYDKEDGFHKILFNPARPIQVRELNQLQTILQKQITRHGDHIFKQGAKVVDGEITTDMTAKHVKLKGLYGSKNIGTFIENTIGSEITDQSNNLKAKILAVDKQDNGDPVVIVKYINSGDNGEKSFLDNTTLYIPSFDNKVTTNENDSTGDASLASIKQGLFYANGHFVLAPKQTAVVDRYSSVPTRSIGLKIDEKIVDFSEDESLLDNAQGTPNFSAPGADRFVIDLVLESRDPELSYDEKEFLRLVELTNGRTSKVTDKTEYSALERTFARRTYDESGDYVVAGLGIEMREHRSNDRGEWKAGTNYLIGDVVVDNNETYISMETGTSSNNSPSQGGLTGVNWIQTDNPTYNRGVYKPESGGDESKLAVGIESGKAYVRGFEITNTSKTFLPIDKARDFDSVERGSVEAIVGNYIPIDDINGVIDVDSYETVQLKSRSNGSGDVVGSARVRGVERNPIGNGYRLFLFSLEMNNNSSIERDVTSITGANFTSNTTKKEIRLAGSVTSSTTVVTGSGTSFETDLSAGDHIFIGDQTRRVVSVDGQNQITIDASISVDGSTYGIALSSVKESDKRSLVFPIGETFIKDVDQTETYYSVSQQFEGTSSSASGGTCSLTISTQSGNFSSGVISNYIIIDTTTGSPVIPTNINANGTSVTFTLSDAHANNIMVVYATLDKNAGSLTRKSKTLKESVVQIQTREKATQRRIKLDKADGLRLKKVLMKPNGFDSSATNTYEIDITDRYEFFDGQKTSYYDLAEIILKGSSPAPTSDIQVTFDYFEHDNGDYFTVNSYPTSTLLYKEIPSFNNQSLADAFDFRPRISDDGSTFTGTGGVVSGLPKRGVSIRTSFEYYLPRKSLVSLGKNGGFVIKHGNSSKNPKMPESPAESMRMFELSLNPYTSNPSTEVDVNQIDNRRYTMQDIGKLERRLNNVEYYTTLSLLEQETNSLPVIDDEGNNRFKNGFIVDSFTTHNVGDITSSDYVCAVDTQQGTLRPMFSQKNINVTEENDNDNQRLMNNYRAFGDIITLPIKEHVSLVNQPIASRVENVNPFSVFTFIGDCKLNPTSDEWFDTERLPDSTTQVEGNFQTLQEVVGRGSGTESIWNSWEIAWSGQMQILDIDVSENESSRIIDRDFSAARNGDWITTSRSETEQTTTRTTTRTTSAEVGNRFRTGIQRSVEEVFDTRIVGDRVVSTAIIPFIRSRNILVQTKAMKPNTELMSFFDDVNVSSYCKPAAQMKYTPNGGLFDLKTPAGSNSNEPARRIDGDSEVCLDKGDVIRGSSSGATAVVVDAWMDGTDYYVDVVNVKGTFQSNEEIVGSISDTTANFVSLEQPSKLKTRGDGSVNFLFYIPNDKKVRFRTGTREFVLVDAQPNETTSARAEYEASGTLETRQRDIESIRNGVVNTQAIRQSGGRVLGESMVDVNSVVDVSEETNTTSSRRFAPTRWVDPLAQTFLIEESDGVFVSKVDLFFATKSNNTPVTVEIRNVVNGYPGKVIVPFSKVTKTPSDVVVSPSKYNIDYEGAKLEVGDFNLATTFEFDAPVYLSGNQEYCLVVLSDSDEYHVWISNMGDQIPNSDETVTEQPYNGVLFKSQNASTWTANQNQDLKFNLWQAKFETNVTGNLSLVNSRLPWLKLDNKPFEFRTGSNYIRVQAKNHGNVEGSLVGIDKPNQIIETNATVSTTELDNVVEVSGIQLLNAFNTAESGNGHELYMDGSYIGTVDSVLSNTTVQMKSNMVSTASGSLSYSVPINTIPSSEIFSNHTIIERDYDGYIIQVSTASCSCGTPTIEGVKTTQSAQMDLIRSTIQTQLFPNTRIISSVKTISGKTVGGNELPFQQDLDYRRFDINENFEFQSTRLIASELNEGASVGDKSLKISLELGSGNENHSPLIDIGRTSVIAIGNRIDNPNEQTKNNGEIDPRPLVENSSITFGVNTISGTSTVNELLESSGIGRYITISGSTNNGTYLVTGLPETGGIEVDGTLNTGTETAVSVNVLTRYYDEIAPTSGSVETKYTTKDISLTNISDYLRVMFDASCTIDSDIDVYIKTASAGSTEPLRSQPWKKLEKDEPIPKVNSGSNNFRDVEINSELTPFDRFKVKLVLRGTNSANPPKVRNLRVIASV